MRRADDYMGEMNPLAISDSDIERLLRGQSLTGPGLSRLGSVLDELRTVRSREIRPAIVSRHVAAAAEAARAAVPAPPATRPAPAPHRWRLVPRLGASVAAFALVIGMTGVAVASDSASPGEPLYGVDVLLENIGIGDGGNRERIAEAQDLTGKGMTVEALDHLSSTLSHREGSGAEEALRTAADRFKQNPSAPELSQEVSDRLSEMLEWMAATDPRDEEFGQGVAERARSLGDDRSERSSGDPEKAGAASEGKAKGSQPGKDRAGKPPGRPGR